MKGRTFFDWFIILLGVIAIMGFCFTPALAEDIDPETGELIIQPEDDMFFEEPGDDMEIYDESFGENYQYTWIPCFSFTGISSTTSYNQEGSYRFFTSATNAILLASINLPSGALLSSARLYYYDNDSGYIQMSVFRVDVADSQHFLGATFTSSGTPGFSSGLVNINHTITNATNLYAISVTSTGDRNLRFKGVRLYWKRQIRTGLSHPFTDIGGLPANFQDAIAALYQSGITSGTTATTYSPNANLTRGQMAVFLARALGLHWGYPY